MLTTLAAVALTLHPHDQAQDQAQAPSETTPQARALSFDGRDDFATVPACEAMAYPGSGGWTVELWLKPVIYPRGEVSIIGQESVGVDAHDPWSIRADRSHFVFRVDGEQGQIATLAFDLTLGVWQHVACVYADTQDGRSMSVYLNGRLIGQQQTDVVMERRIDPVYMGALGKGRFTGLIDEARVWAGALSEGEVRLAQAGVVSGQDERLRAWWSFDEPAGPAALDRSGHHAHAVLGVPHDSNDTSAPTRAFRSTR